MAAKGDKSCGWSGQRRHFNSRTRREFLKVGVLGGIGVTLGDFLALRESCAISPDGRRPPADAVIVLFLEGGLSHVDTFDPKPDAAIEIRGGLGSVKTSTGEHFGGLLPHSAAVADRLAVVRSFTHTEAAHERGQHSMMTGHQPSAAVVYPSLGAVVAHELGPRRDLPPYICVPEASNRWLGTGYLPPAFGPFSLGSDPASSDFTVRDLALPPGVDPQRAARQRSLLERVNAHFKQLEESSALDAMDTFYQRAYDLLSSEHARNAFDMHQEDPKLRDTYGRHAVGQRVLMARRLVEAGVRFVTVTYGGWDHHKQIEQGLRTRLPEVDQALAALVRDLHDRGLLERTMVVVLTEFGRTPRVNRDGGRDHWPKVFSVVFAGGGVKGGTIIGASDPTGAEPTDQPVRPADMAATIFTQLGIDPAKRLLTAGNRPIDIVRHGKVIDGLV